MGSTSAFRALRVQSTQTWSIHIACISDRNYGLGYILHMWVLGPLGVLVYTWALEGFLYPYFEVYVCTITILGPFGVSRGSKAPEGQGFEGFCMGVSKSRGPS